ncbi:D-erythronate dehydrogenase [Paraburkholderia sp. 22099]|jgi:nucleoside-diphosphate-sugar epimerase|uniref:Nucleoside-diphosphate-sugar epimerase n=1 Tax=Paraburkholderia terricola TaxID=169427 RepID=A0ABU1LJV3_9BURK|nr:D-erythronate dehydrogenase [Paraburkholderia terricola]ORC51559.1 NAD-dependent epimerase [Burkholderia sp. A27]AXE95965.1 NAD-dependent epimerase [Paraburkholderia terricola]MDR6407003.1 nucleoside-diphosphate-sugar epimerase [Paraburkholderia terricola]MDR6449379.1 nucleoside-diphosphate-sugar epimerase [Paraburkholderia terricola]MDR6479318.1 nucleoside-diphosphate-sugar epimerase [Paraburkholderia terricola]
MKVLITGGAGFLGQRLARELLARGSLKGADGKPQAITELVLLDVVRASDFGDSRVRAEVGDIAERSVLERVIDERTSAIFHLAAIVSGQAEADFDLGMRINLDASRLLLEVCRQRGHQPRVLFTSSVAVYGGELPDMVRDDTALKPQSSYGAQKAIAELLLNDYARRGFVDGRVVRLPTISVRPGKPNAAASSFASGIIREPLNGEAAVCPVAGATRLWLLSPRKAIESLIAGLELDAALLGNQRVLNLPGISVSVDEMVAALREVAGEEAVKRIVWERDARVEKIVGSWPGRWDTSRAESLGLTGERSFADVIRSYIADEQIQIR